MAKDKSSKVSRSAGGVVLNKKGLVLIVNQRGKSWSLPKGHLEKGEDTLTAAKREIHEESGLNKITYVKPLGTYRRPRMGKHGGDDRAEMKELTFFLFTTEEEKLKPIDPHNPEARWVSADEIPRMLTHPKDQEFFRSIQNQLKRAL